MKPIIFSTPMVQAILDGKKTQTRRVIKDGANRTPQNIGREKFFKMVNALNNKPFFGAGFYKDSDVFEYKGEILTDAVYFKCPYKPGDVLWVRETWCTHEDMADVFENQLIPGYYYKANEIGKEWVNDREIVKWRPSIFMPRAAARLFLLVKTVRAERLQEISHFEAQCEGVAMASDDDLKEYGYRAGFKQLWDSLNKKRGYPWDSNPWVWVIEFERTEAI